MSIRFIIDQPIEGMQYSCPIVCTDYPVIVYLYLALVKL
jgi:hypothetical protein